MCVFFYTFCELWTEGYRNLISFKGMSEKKWVSSEFKAEDQGAASEFKQKL